jgi:hypothetical protein
MAIERGTISSADHVVKYDDEGIEYWVYTITVGGRRYTSRTQDGLYLVSGSPIVFETENDTIAAGYCPREDVGWGRNVGRLRKRADLSDKFEFVEGVVVEKRKRVSQTVNWSRDYLEREPGVGYTVVLEDRDFHATSPFGEPLKAGMRIEAVLQQNDAVLLRIDSTGRMIGNPRKTWVVWTLVIAAFNAGMFYLDRTGRSHVINYDSVLVVINVFLVLALLMSIAIHVKENEVMRFYQAMRA